MSEYQLSLFDLSEFEEVLSFNDVLEFLDSIDCINCGGCGVSALAIHRWRVSHGLRSDEFVILYHERDYRDYAQEAIDSGDWKDIYRIPHIALKVGNRYYDSTGNARENFSHCKYIARGLDESGLVWMLNNYDSWNPNFSRDYIPYIEEKLSIDLSDINI